MLPSCQPATTSSASPGPTRRRPPSPRGAPRCTAANWRTSTAAYVGDGANRWPSVDTRDAARLYRLALESGEAGRRWHAVAEEGIPFRAIAEVIGRKLGAPVRSISAEEAVEHFGFIGMFAGLDGPASSEQTCATLGWEPTGAGLLDDLEHGHYLAGG